MTDQTTQVNQTLLKYIEQNIFPQYAKNDWGHNLDHIKYVIRRSLHFASTLPKSDNINYDIVYAVAAFHDLGHHIDAFHHEQVSAQMLRDDHFMQDFFSAEDITLVAEAIEDHRSHLKHPRRSIYGKIIAAADCNINIDVMMRRTYTYRICNFSDMSLEDIIEESRQHLKGKYGRGGYARSRIYFDDPEFDAALSELQDLVEDEPRFRARYLRVNQLADPAQK